MRYSLAQAHVVLGVLLFSICGADATTVKLANHSFSIPARYLDESAFSGWLGRLPGLDNSSSEALLTIGAAEVASAIPGYQQRDGRLVEDLNIRLDVLTKVDRQRTLDPDFFRNIWSGTGSYRNRIIDIDPLNGFFRAYRKIEYPDSWEAFTISPEKTSIPRDLFSFWIGHCLRLRAPITPSGHHTSCTSYAVVGDVAIFYRVSEQNLGKTKALRRYLANLIRDWQNSADN